MMTVESWMLSDWFALVAGLTAVGVSCCWVAGHVLHWVQEEMRGTN